MPCEFLHQAHHLGWLDDDGDGDTLKNGTKVELPVYLASALSKENHLVVLAPLLFGPQLRNSLKADAEVVNLRDKNEFFFVHGLRVAELTEDDHLRETLPDVLYNAFKARYKRMLDTCLTGADGDPGGLTHRLSATESNCARPPSRTRALVAIAGRRYCGARSPAVLSSIDHPASPPPLLALRARAIRLLRPPLVAAWRLSTTSIPSRSRKLERLPPLEGAAGESHHRVRSHQTPSQEAKGWAGAGQGLTGHGSVASTRRSN